MYCIYIKCIVYILNVLYIYYRYCIYIICIVYILNVLKPSVSHDSLHDCRAQLNRPTYRLKP